MENLACKIRAVTRTSGQALKGDLPSEVPVALDPTEQHHVEPLSLPPRSVIHMGNCNIKKF